MTLDDVKEHARNKSPESRVGFAIADHFDEDEANIIFEATLRNNLNVEQMIILFAIRKAENGGKNHEFGIEHPRCEIEMDKRPDETMDIQAGWCAATIKKNYKRWKDAGCPDDFITFLGGRYCPILSEIDDPRGLSKNWITNVKKWVKKLGGEDFKMLVNFQTSNFLLV